MNLPRGLLGPACLCAAALACATVDSSIAGTAPGPGQHAEVEVDLRL